MRINPPVGTGSHGTYCAPGAGGQREELSLGRSGKQADDQVQLCVKRAVMGEALGLVGAQGSSNRPRLLAGRSLKESFLEEALPKLTFERGLEVSQAGVKK